MPLWGLATGAGVGALSGLLQKDPNSTARTAMESAYKQQLGLYSDQFNNAMENLKKGRLADYASVWNKYTMNQGAADAAANAGRNEGAANTKNLAVYADAKEQMANKYTTATTSLSDNYNNQLRQAAIDHQKTMAQLPAEQPWYSRMLTGAVAGASAGLQVDKGLNDMEQGNKLIDSINAPKIAFANGFGENIATSSVLNFFGMGSTQPRNSVPTNNYTPTDYSSMFNFGNLFSYKRRTQPAWMQWGNLE